MLACETFRLPLAGVGALECLLENMTSVHFNQPGEEGS
jgi:hypothetical protein